MSNLVPYEGRVVESVADDRDELRRRIRHLESQLEDARSEAHHAKGQARNALRSLQNLQRILTPFRNAILGIFGELEDVGVSSGGGEIDARWQSWKEKLPGKPASVITALLEHRELTVKQLMAATKSGQNTIYQVMSKLGKLNLVNSSGGKYSLRALPD